MRTLRTFAPASACLRVGDKFFSAFILEDSEIKAGATLLYLYLSHLCRHQDRCWPAQETLARACKCSVKSIQNHLRQLAAAQYIRIEKHSGHSVYVLLLSPRVERLLALSDTELTPEQGEKTAPADTKKLRVGGEKCSPYKRVFREQEKHPLSPSRQPTAHAAPALHPSSPCQSGFSPDVEVAERGDFSSSPCSAVLVSPPERRTEQRTEQRAEPATAFDQLFAVWPVQKDRLVASKIFDSLQRRGKLPELATLLTSVERMKALDRHWKNGCVPALSTWLRGERWTDEPYQPDLAPASSPASAPAPTTPVDLELQQRVRALHEHFGSPLFSPPVAVSIAPTVPQPAPAAAPPHVRELASTATALCSLWPDTSRQTVMTRLFLERQNGTDVPSLVAQAQDYVKTAATPLPMLEWLRVREEVGAGCAV